MSNHETVKNNPTLYLGSTSMMKYQGPFSGSVRLFKENATESVTIEEEQNALDNRINKSGDAAAVIVEFDVMQVQSSEIPGFDALKKVYEESFSFWKDLDDENRAQLAKGFKEALVQTKTNVLYIRDNASGLKGAKDAKPNSGYHALLMSSGASVKDSETSGGSVGEGSNAFIAASNIGSVIYSTQTEDGFQGHIGAYSVVPYINEKGEMTQNVAYWTDNEKGRPIEGLYTLPGLKERSTSGTDIMVLCYGDSDWKNKIILTTIKKYWMAIRNKRLVVHVGDIVIDHTTLEDLLDQYSYRKGIGFVIELYNKMGSSKPIVETMLGSSYGNITFNDDSLELELYETTGGEEGIMVVREMEMDMFHYKVPSSCIGLLRVKGDSANRFFRKVENVRHDKWEANLYTEDPTNAQKAINGVKSFVNEAVKKHFGSPNSGHDAIGIPSSLYDREAEKEVVLGKTATISSVIPRSKSPRPPKKGGKSEKKMSLISLKVKCIDQVLGKYEMELEFKKPLKSGVIDVVAIGEQSNLKQNVKWAHIPAVLNAWVKSGSIEFSSEQRKSILHVVLELEEPKFCSLGVRVK